MDRKEWVQIKTVVAEALALELSQRNEYITQACDNNERLITKVKEQLRYISQSEEEGFLEGVVTDQHTFIQNLEQQWDQPEHPGELINRTIGPYRITELLGRGGMGAVYKAERVDGAFHQTVAIKLIKRDVESEETIRRFKQEREILAGLHHPNIAQLYDGGVTKDGIPYLVMEFVDGEPITRYCKRKNLDLNGHLDLFLKVCEAVMYAHRNLVVHRDLKPSNILVTEDGTIKLLDFGVAKLLDDTAYDSTTKTRAPLTQTGRPIMTPEYAAPEQFRAEKITTLADVYSLGVLFYELLTGLRPYDLSEKSFAEIERLVCEKEPPKLSTQAGRLPASSNGFFSPDKLRGDLDVISVKTLRKEPKERYGSVQELQEDIKRHITGLPIAARPATARYRIRKFARRHRTGMTVTALVILMIAGFITALIYQQSITRQERDQAQLEAQKATEVTEFLLGLFEANEPLTSPTDTITARALLERGIRRAEEMENQPLVQAQMLDVMGRVYQSLGRYDNAEPLLRKALTLREVRLGGKHVEVAESLNHLAVLLMTKGKYNDAEPIFNRSINLMRAVLGENDSLITVTMNNLAILLQKQGKFAESETLHREVLEMRRDLFGDVHADVSGSLYNLAATLYWKGNYDEAGTLYKKALDMQSQLLGHTHSSTIITMNGLAATLEANGDFASADSLYREALSIQRRLLGNEHPHVATIITNLANLLVRQNKLAEAEALHKEALAIRRNYLDEANPEVGESLYCLAFLRTRMGDYEEAEQLYRETIDAWRPVLGENHPNIAKARNNIAHNLTKQGRYREALAINRDVLEKHRTIYGDKSSQVALSFGNIAWNLYHTEQYTEAEKYYRKALAMRRALYDSDHPDIADALSGLGAVLCEQDKYEEAENLQKKSLRMRRKLHGDNHPRVATSLSRLGELHMRTARYSEAESTLLEAFQLRHNELGIDHPKTNQSAQQLLDLYQAWNKQEKVAEYRALLAEGL